MGTNFSQLYNEKLTQNFDVKNGAKPSKNHSIYIHSTVDNFFDWI